MVKVIFFQDKKKKFFKFEAVGHANFNNNNPDIVCAGVSTLLQGIILGLKRILHIKIKLTHKKGRLICELPEIMKPDLKEKAQVLINTLYLSLKEIEKQYPNNVKIIVK